MMVKWHSILKSYESNTKQFATVKVPQYMKVICVETSRLRPVNRVALKMKIIRSRIVSTLYKGAHKIIQDLQTCLKNTKATKVHYEHHDELTKE